MKIGTCPICGGETKEDVVEIPETLNGEMYIIKGVKAEVCLQCGERMYSSDELRKIESVRKNITKRLIKPIEIRQVNVVCV
jgi:YgiT-type zinc finger domain-containing protein